MTIKNNSKNYDVSIIEEAIRLAGGQKKLANLMNVTQPMVANWLKRNRRIPAHQVIPLEMALKGKITRHEIRPDLYPKEEK